MSLFGVVFPNRSFPLDASKFVQVDTHRWLLDMSTFVGEAYDQVKEVCIFLVSELVLPADKALAVYVQAPGSEFEYRGAVHNACPSAVLPLAWPQPGGATTGQPQVAVPGMAPMTALIGISVEPLATLPMANVGMQKKFEELALKVGQNLFNFMQSFCSVQNKMLVVPTDILDLWFRKFQDRAKKDPDYVNRFSS
eukprot:jgi/Mesen1/5316/ME000265S04475